VPGRYAHRTGRHEYKGSVVGAGRAHDRVGQDRAASPSPPNATRRGAGRRPLMFISTQARFVLSI